MSGSDSGYVPNPGTAIRQQVRVFCDDRMHQSIDSQVGHLSIRLKGCHYEVNLGCLECLHAQWEAQHSTQACTLQDCKMQSKIAMESDPMYRPTVQRLPACVYARYCQLKQAGQSMCKGAQQPWQEHMK